MAPDDRFTDDEWKALALGPAAAASALVTTSHPGFIGIIKEARAGMKATKDLPTGAAASLVDGLLKYAEANDLGGSLVQDEDDVEASRSAALGAVENAGLAATKLTEEEREGYVGWLLGIARAMAEAVPDKGEDANVSAAEEQTMAEIERKLRRG